MSGFVLSEPLDPELGQMLIEAAGTRAFAEVLLNAARQVDAVDEIYAYQIAATGALQAVLSCGDRQDISERTGEYKERFHKLDPVARAHGYLGRGRGFASRVLADQIPAGGYRETCFERPGFVDKICIGWQGQERRLVLSFYRGKRSCAEPGGSLSSLGDMAMAALKHHMGLTQPWGHARRPREPRALLEERLTRSFPTLTTRERQIVAMTLVGFSATKIAEDLGIRPATVLTYRQRAYQRMEFSRASDFLGELLS